MIGRKKKIKGREKKRKYRRTEKKKKKKREGKRPEIQNIKEEMKGKIKTNNDEFS